MRQGLRRTLVSVLLHASRDADDSAPARPSIGLRRVKFTSGVYIDANGSFHLNNHPEVPNYVGPPSPEIDAEWSKLADRKKLVWRCHCVLAEQTLAEWFHATPDEVRYQGGDEALRKLALDTNGLYFAQ
jgi:hypothetical protein